MTRSMILILAIACWGCDQGDARTNPDADAAIESAPDETVEIAEEDTLVVDAPDDPSTEDAGVTVDPPIGGSSGGSGGGPASGEVRVTADGSVTYRIIAPSGVGPHPLMIVYSGTEGGANMTSNILSVMAYCGISDFVFAIIDGVDYWEDGEAGSYVLDHVRGLYDIDNDRTHLLSESAGTRAGLQLGLDLRQSWFAAYWANDVNASAAPTLPVSDLGFSPYGNSGPGGDFPDASAIVSGMIAAGYRCPAPAPYDGPGSGIHGSTEQFLAAMQWFAGKSRF